MTVGFIGLGNLGSAMVRRFVSQGTNVIAWNRTASKAAALQVQTVPDPAMLLVQSNIVMLNLFDSGAVQSVMTMKGGLLSGNCRGKVILDTTTNDPLVVKSFHEQIAEAGGSYLEAPVLGSVGPALEGSLTTLVSGDRKTLDAAMPFLKQICGHVFYFEKPGIATAMKLANNLVLSSLMASLAAATALGEQAGINRNEVLEILSHGAGNSGVLRGKKEKLGALNFEPQFSNAAIVKDLRYLTMLTATTPHAAELTRDILRLYEEASVQGGADLDFSSVYSLFRT